MDSDLIIALRSRGVTVFTPLETAGTGKSDEEQLICATELGCAIYTHNICDFCRLNAEWIGVGREHAGMILASQQRFSVGEQLRRMLRILSSLSAESMRNRLEFLARWS